MPKHKQTSSPAETPARKRTHRYNSPRLTVTVTAEHIQLGKRGSSTRCMVAEAIREQFPQFMNPSADIQTIRFSDPVRQLRYVYLTPYEPHLAMVLFDTGITPKPFAFTLKRASQIVRTANWGAIQGSKKKRASTVRKAVTEGAKHPSEARSESGGKPPLLGGRRLQAENSGGRGTPTIIGGRAPMLGALAGRARGSTGAGAHYSSDNMGKRRIFGSRLLLRGREKMLREMGDDPAKDPIMNAAAEWLAEAKGETA